MSGGEAANGFQAFLVVQAAARRAGHQAVAVAVFLPEVLVEDEACAATEPAAAWVRVYVLKMRNGRPRMASDRLQCRWEAMAWSILGSR